MKVTRRRAIPILVAAALVLGGCGRAEGVTDTRRALEQAGYRDVDISLRSGGGIGVARVEADAAGAPPAEDAAKVAWAMLPVHFDRLVVALGDQATSFSYEDLSARFGPRAPSLDGGQIDEEVVESGVRLMLLLSAGALLSVGAVVATAVLVLRAGRRARHRAARQDVGPAS